jgi:uncharacterized membrane protein YhdT
MRHQTTVFAVVVLTTLVVDILWARFRRHRSGGQSVWVAVAVGAAWILIVGVWRNQHAADFPGRYPIWFDFAISFAPAVLGAVACLFIGLIARTINARRHDHPKPAE